MLHPRYPRPRRLAPRNPPAASACGGQRAVALVFVLAVLVLMLGLTLAFFSRATQQRQTGVSRTGLAATVPLAETALGILLQDLQTEAQLGWEEPGPGDDPVLANRSNPRAVPERAGVGGADNLLKASRHGTPFFSGGPLRASAIATPSVSGNGQQLPAAHWTRPGLLRPAEEEAFTAADAPDWIYLDRAGQTPTAFGSASSNPAPDNPDFVVGRFACMVYDLGGLVDLNLAGNRLDEEQNRRRGRLHQVSLQSRSDGSERGPLFFGRFDDFVAWREREADPETLAARLFAGTETFLGVAEGGQALLDRQDLLDFAARGNDALVSPSAVPLATTFSRDRNAPLFEHDPQRPKEDADFADSINPSLLLARFGAETTLGRGADPAVTVPAGTPVMPRRFPLGKLALLSDPAADPASILYYFGLERRGDQIWEYVRGFDETDPVSGGYAGTRIKRLEEVAAGTPNDPPREPNFFEILQAVIATDSLGKAGGNSQSSDHRKDQLQNLQVLRIGANIIDQWDADDLPTVIRYPSGNTGELLDLYGTENLPYISQMGVVGHRPEYNRNLFQIWGLFDVWNPHQNAMEAPKGISEFRIVPVAGRAQAGFWYTIMWFHGGGYYNPMYVSNHPSGGRYWTPYSPIAGLNNTPERQLAFPASQLCVEPTTIRGGTQPVREGDFPGLLLVEQDVAAIGRDPLIAPKPNRTVAMQRILNGIMDAVAPYAAVPENYTDSGTTGDRVYPAGTAFSNFNTAAWAAVPPLPPPLPGETARVTTEPTAVYANYGIKTANHTLFIPDPADPLAFELQARVNGQWRTYQRFEDFNTRSAHIVNRLDPMLDPRDPPQIPQEAFLNRLLENTFHAAPAPNLTECFYGWRGQGVTDSGGGTVDSWIKFDPRSRRWGASRVLRDALGNSPHATDVPWNYNEDVTRWIVTRESPKTGWESGDQSTFGAFGFQFMRRPGHPGTPPLFSAWGGAATNNPDLDWPDAHHPLRYSDRDGVIRPADGYWGARPTVVGRIAQRSLILNRPFRSVGELGHVFRDLPWKTLDFSSRWSADLGLLDVFSLDESQEPDAVVAGKVNLNSAGVEVLAALLEGTAVQLPQPAAGIPAVQLGRDEAVQIAEAIVAARAGGQTPFLHKGDLVPRVLHPAAGDGPLAGEIIKAGREAAIRTLAEIGTTRTWNFLIDLVVQSGHLPPGTSDPARFLVRGQQRLWIAVAMDRLNGEVLDMQLEVVHE